MARPYSMDLRTRVVGLVTQGCSTRAGEGVWGERGERSQVVAAAAADGQRGAGQDGRTSASAAAFATGVAAGAAGRAAGADAAGAVGVKVSYGALWLFLHREGISFKKNRARQRAGQAGDRPAARAVEEVSGPA